MNPLMSPPFDPSLLAAIVGGLLIFAARVCDVSLGTIRTIYMLRGHRLTSATIAVFESAIFITAISAVLKGGVTGEPLKLVGYVAGYATGVFVGMSIERWIASGWTMMRVMPQDDGEALVERIRLHGEAVTVIRGEGRDGPRPILFVVARRRRARELLATVRRVAPDAFITVDGVGEAINGTLPVAPPRLSAVLALRGMFRK